MPKRFLKKQIKITTSIGISQMRFFNAYILCNYQVTNSLSEKIRLIMKNIFFILKKQYQKKSMQTLKIQCQGCLKYYKQRGIKLHQKKCKLMNSTVSDQLQEQPQQVVYESNDQVQHRQDVQIEDDQFQQNVEDIQFEHPCLYQIPVKFYPLVSEKIDRRYSIGQIANKLQEMFDKRDSNLIQYALNYDQLEECDKHDLQWLFNQGWLNPMDQIILPVIDDQCKNKMMKWRKAFNTDGVELDIIRLMRYNGLSMNQTGKIHKDLEMCLSQAFQKIQSGCNMQDYFIAEINGSYGREARLLNIKDINKYNNKQINQVIHKDVSSICNFYMDIDIKEHITKDSSIRQELIENLRNAIIKVLKLYKGTDINESSIKFIGQDLLESFHVYTKILVNISDLPTILTIIRQILEKQMNLNLKEVMDNAVYNSQTSSFRRLRIPNSHKIKQGKKKINKLYNQLFDDSDTDNEQSNNNDKYIYTQPEKIIKALQVDPYDFLIQPLSINKQAEIIHPSMFFHHNPIFEFNYDHEQIIDDEINDYLSQNYLSQLKRIKNMVIYEGVCPIHHFEHSSDWSRTLFFSNKIDGIYVRCRKDFDTQIQISKNVCAETQKQKLDQFIQQAQLNNDLDGQILIDREELKQLDLFKQQQTIVKAQTGAGKTTMLVNNLIKHLRKNPQARFLFISCRISFSQAISSDINKKLRQQLGQNAPQFQQYREIEPKQWPKQQLLMIQAESLGTLLSQMEFSNTEQTYYYDLSIIDETMSVFMQCSSGCGQSVSSNVFTISRILQAKSKRTVFMDATFNNATVKLLQQMTSKECLIYNCSYKNMENDQAIFYFKKSNDRDTNLLNMYADKLYQNIKQRKHVFGHISSRTNIKKVALMLIKKGVNPNKILILHGNQQELDKLNGKEMHHIQKKQLLFNDKIQFNNYQVVLATKTVTVGIDFNKDEFPQFQTGIHLYSKNLTNSLECFQAIHRFRAIKNQHIFIDSTYIPQSVYDTLFDRQIVPSEYFRNMIVSDTCETKIDTNIVNQYKLWFDCTKKQLQVNSLQIITGFLKNAGYDVRTELLRQSDIQSKFSKITLTKTQPKLIPSLNIAYKCHYIINNEMKINNDEVIPDLESYVITYIQSLKWLSYKITDKVIDPQLVFANQRLDKPPKEQPIKDFHDLFIYHNIIENKQYDVTYSQNLAKQCVSILSTSKKQFMQDNAIDIMDTNKLQFKLIKALIFSLCTLDDKKLSDQFTIHSDYHKYLNINNQTLLIQQIVKDITNSNKYISIEAVVSLLNKQGIKYKSIKKQENNVRQRCVKLSIPQY